MEKYIIFCELVKGLREELKSISANCEQVIFDMKPVYEEIVAGELEEGKIVKYVEFIHLYSSLKDYAEKVDKMLNKIGKAYMAETDMYNSKLENLEGAILEKSQIIDNLITRSLENNQQVIINEVHRVLALVEDNVKVISTAEKMKKKGKIHKSEANPNFKNYAPSDYMVELYRAGMSCKEIGLRYGMTENGVRERLKKLKVYKPRQYNKRN